MRSSTINIALILDQPDDALLTEVEVAAIRRVDPKTINRERLSGYGCPYLKIGRSVRYRLGDFKAFVKANVVRSTTEADQLKRNSNR